MRARTARCLAGALIDIGDHDAVVEVLTAELASPGCTGFERALTCHTLLRVLPDGPDARNRADEMRAIFVSLGIVRVPPLRFTDLSEFAEAGLSTVL